MMNGNNGSGKVLIKKMFNETYPGIAIELGVWKGGLTRVLAEKFKEVHAVDSWHTRAYEDTTEWNGMLGYLKRYSKKYNIPPLENLLQEEYEKVYEHVCKKFKKHKHVHIHRMTTDEFFTEYKGGADLIYVDASHSYKDVLSDLKNSWKILNKNGVMIADDYQTDGWKPDVPKAVHEFSTTNELGFYVEEKQAIFQKQ
jgi:hypothetical protein